MSSLIRINCSSRSLPLNQQQLVMLCCCGWTKHKSVQLFFPNGVSTTGSAHIFKSHTIPYYSTTTTELLAGVPDAPCSKEERHRTHSHRRQTSQSQSFVVFRSLCFPCFVFLCFTLHNLSFTTRRTCD